MRLVATRGLEQPFDSRLVSAIAGAFRPGGGHDQSVGVLEEGEVFRAGLTATGWRLDDAKATPVSGTLGDGLGERAVTIRGNRPGRPWGRRAVPAETKLLSLHSGVTASAEQPTHQAAHLLERGATGLLSEPLARAVIADLDACPGLGGEIPGEYPCLLASGAHVTVA
jgi:hypothetical protein